MPAYLVEHDDFAKPRAVEARDPKAARAHVGKELRVKLLKASEVFDLPEDVELQVAKRNGG